MELSTTVNGFTVESDSDLPPAYGLAKQIQLTPLSHS